MDIATIFNNSQLWQTLGRACCLPEAYLIGAGNDPGEVSLLLILTFDNGFHDAGVVRTQVDCNKGQRTPSSPFNFVLPRPIHAPKQWVIPASHNDSKKANEAV